MSEKVSPIGSDGDHVDVYLGPHLKSNHVYIVDQIDHETGKFDEHKVILGAGSEAQALTLYKRAFSDGRGQARIGAVTGMTTKQLKGWLEHGDTTKPVGKLDSDKLPHAAVGYETRSTHAAKYCAKCSMYAALGDAPSCTLVKSPINSRGYCRRYSVKF